MIDQILAWDYELFLFLNGLGTSSWDGFWMVVTDRFTFIPLYIFLLYLIYREMGWRMLLNVAIVAALMILFTDQVTNLFKYGFERLRPCRDPNLVDKMRLVTDGCGMYGFFSGHAANSMATAIFIGLLLRPFYKLVTFLLVIWSIIVAYSRIYVGVHFPLDIICGLLFGTASGYIFYQLTAFFKNRFEL